MAETAQERTEEATPKRRQQARRKGTVARSSDLNGALVLLGLILVFPLALGKLGSGFMSAVDVGLRNMPTELTFPVMVRHAGSVLAQAVPGLLYIMGTCLVIGLSSNFAQVGFVFSGESLVPSLAKLNPASGLKRLFSRTAVFDGVKAGAKACLFMYLGWTAVQASWPEIVRLGSVPPGQSISTAGAILKALAIRIAFVWLFLAAIDYAFQRKTTNKQLRMTKEEIRQEMKESETSPELKMAQAARRRKMSRGRMMDAVKSADVIVTNPTHYAVAIKYEPGKTHAPIVVGKGADILAAKIREVAAENKIPIIPNPPLARALYKKCEVGDFVPRELFQAVAEVLAYVYRTIKKVRA